MLKSTDSAIDAALAQAREEAWSTPLARLDVSKADRFARNLHWPFFDRLRAEAPVHYCAESEFGAYWSVSSYETIVAVDTNHRQFSSAEGIFIGDRDESFRSESFISSDAPIHAKWRKPVMPGVGPKRLQDLEAVIRGRVCDILDGLPVGEEFDWVEHVSIELTTQMLATLFDFPFEDRRKLTFWSDVVTSTPQVGNNSLDPEERKKILMECVGCFTELWRDRQAREPGFDFISLMAHDPATADMAENPMTLLGNLMLLIVGGNDTTRNSISGGVMALNDFPEQYDRLSADPAVIPNMVSEIIRWQTPLAYMRRTALEDVEVGGRTIRQGDKVVMWYVSGNRDDAFFDDPYEFDIARAKARSHLSFGFGVHRCMGNRVAEMQLRILWEEIQKRFKRVEVTGEAERVMSNFVLGFSKLPVTLRV